MDVKPTVAQLSQWLRDLVDWENFGDTLPGIKAAHIKLIQKEQRDIDAQKRALYNKWLSVNSKACWRHVITALENAEEDDLKEEVTAKVMSLSGGGGGGGGTAIGATGGGATPLAATPVDLDKLRRALKDVMRESYVQLKGATRNDLIQIAGELFAANVIGETVLEAPTYDNLIGSFRASMNFKRSKEEIEALCGVFLKALSVVGGPGQAAAKKLADDWKKKVYEECNVELSLELSSFPIYQTKSPEKGQSLQDQKNISKWLKEGTVELSVIRINMIGPPRSGKTCTQRLLLGEPRPEATTDSTPVARSAIQAVMASTNDENVLKRVSRDGLLERLHNHLKTQPDRNTESTSSDQNMSNATQLQEDDQLATDTFDIEEDDTISPDELINEISKRISETNVHISDRWFYIIDTGGQPAYQELLPLFAQRPGINIITINLSKRSDELIEVEYGMNGKTYKLDERMRFTNGEFVINTIQKNRDAYKKLESNQYSDIKIETPPFPLYLVLGTHYDKPNSEKHRNEIETHLKALHAEQSEFKKCIILHNLYEIIYPINTISSLSERENDRTNLCQKIICDKATVKIKNMPIRWFAFQLYLQKEAKDSSFLTMKKVLIAGKKLQMNENDVITALKFLHNATILLYYDDCDELKDIVIFNPQFIIETLSRLIALSCIEKDEDITPLINISVTDCQPYRLNLRESGQFSEDLLLKLKVQEPDTKKDYEVFSTVHFKPRHFIILLEHLNIICKLNGTTYFLPCALPAYKESTPHPKPIDTIAKFLLVWNTKGTKGIPVSVPHGIFPLTIVHLLQKQTIDFAKNCSRYRDAMSLQIENTTIFHIINKYTHIEVYLSHNKPSACHLVCKEILEAVEKSCTKINIVQPTLAFQCDECNYRSVDEKCQKASCFCDQLVINEDSCYSCWFNQSSTKSNTIVAANTYMDSKPTVADMIDYLRDLVNWKSFAHFLPDIKSSHAEIIERNNRDDISDQKIALYTKWLAVYPKATWRDVIEALEKAEEKAIAQHVKDSIVKHLHH